MGLSCMSHASLVSHDNPIEDPCDLGRTVYAIPTKLPLESHGDTIAPWKSHESLMEILESHDTVPLKHHGRPTEVPSKSHEGPMKAQWKYHGKPVKVWRRPTEEPRKYIKGHDGACSTMKIHDSEHGAFVEEL